MKISRHSWHYKFLKFWGKNPPYHSNLCQYFWTVVGVMFVTALMIPFLPIIVPIGLIADWQERRKWAKLEAKEAGKEEKPSLFKEWLKAKKQKVCPLIEFED